MVSVLDVRQGVRVAGRCPNTGEVLVGTYREEAQERLGEGRAVPQYCEDWRAYIFVWCPTCFDLHAADRILAKPDVALLT